ncbi:hypothetical protein FACS189434_01420 [Bacteroidia bacterium]|nr:hypothetical protein FACS189434_01420 [Bacteroidia bacterium]
MKYEIISKLYNNFDLAVNKTDEIEFWFARDLQALLGYGEWRNFQKVVEKAQMACSNAGQVVPDHLLASTKWLILHAL